jgi:hypothetical protein
MILDQAIDHIWSTRRGRGARDLPLAAVELFFLRHVVWNSFQKMGKNSGEVRRDFAAKHWHGSFIIIGIRILEKL